MSTAIPPAPPAERPGPTPGPPPGVRRTRSARAASSLLARGEPMLWLTGGSLVLAVAMIVGLLLLVLVQGIGTFWPGEILRVQLHDGTVYMGEVTRDEAFKPGEPVLQTLPPAVVDAARAAVDAEGGWAHRRLIRTANFDLTGTHFHWVSGFDIAESSTPRWAMIIERLEWGRFYGFPAAFVEDGEPAADARGLEGEAREAARRAIWDRFRATHAEVVELRERINDLEEYELGEQNRLREQARLAMRRAELDHGDGSPEHDAARQRYERVKAEVEAEFTRINREISELQLRKDRYTLIMETAQGQPKPILVADIVRMFPANQLGPVDKAGVYLSRWGEFLTDEPREANSEGGVFPVIFGTVVMTLLMCVLVVPFGVMAALYLREYARAGPVVSAVRIAINNLAGVPSIVFGVFGLGFFIYIVGGFIDGGPQNAFGTQMPPGPWLGLLAATAAGTAAGLVCFFASLNRAGTLRTRRQRAAATASMVLLIGSSAAGLLLIATVPFFEGLFRARLADGSPTFGTGGLVWASFTLALLTLPVVIVATEEALAAVPNSMREGSYACGASKWQTIQRIVLPRAMPGIMTGTILAMARGAGEVAPLMLVGAVKLAPELPLSLSPSEQFGINRSFMHLGFHIYDLGFQSQNSEAAKPMVFTTTLLLIAIIAALNLAAIFLRSRLRRRFVASAF